MKNKIKLKDIIKKINDVENGKLLEEDYQLYIKENLSVNKYIGIKEMYTIIEVILKDNPRFDIDNSAEVNMNIDLSKFFDILLYYTNIECLVTDKTDDNYDILTNNYIYDYILSICKKSYDKFCNGFEQVIGYSSFAQIKTLLTYLNDNLPKDDEFAELIKTSNSVYENLGKNSQAIENVLKIQDWNDPTATAVVEEIKKLKKEQTEDATKVAEKAKAKFEKSLKDLNKKKNQVTTKEFLAKK